jgi:hypothetical protein
MKCVNFRPSGVSFTIYYFTFPRTFHPCESSMIVSAGRAGQPAQTNRAPTSAPPERPTVRKQPAAYGRVFWFSYAANLCIMVAITLLFRYADFVTLLGGDEFDLGWIVGVGMVGSLAMRCAQGVGIDR